MAIVMIKTTTRVALGMAEIVVDGTLKKLIARIVSA